MKQTAVEWLVEKIIEDELIDVKNGHQFIHLQSIAKEMEKEQIKDAFDEGNPNGFIIKCGEQYYNETYKNS